MMEKKYQLVAWTKNITDRENARLYVVPSVELDLMEPLITEVSECRRLQKKDGGRVSPQLARRFIRVYEASARLDIFTGNFDYAIRFLLQAADYCIWEDDYNSPYYQFVAYCEEAISLARKYGFEYVLEETFFLKSWGNWGKCLKKSRGNRGFEYIKSRGNREMFLLVVDYL